MKLTFKMCRAFTMVELMVTLAIVVIITLVAMPSMENYIAQGKVSDAISGAAVLQTMIAKQVARNETVTGSGSGLTLPATLGRYVNSFSVSPNGVISITTTSSAFSVSLTLTPAFSTTTTQITWVCAVTNSSFNRYVPSQCQI